MTVEELTDRISTYELAQWDEWYALEAEAAEAAQKQAEQAAKQPGRRRP